MTRLSCIVPSYKDPLLFKTIQSILDNSGLPPDELEIIAVWDGYYPSGNLIINDDRVRYVHLGRNRGMRGAINAGVSVARGKYLMRTDEHCAFDKDFAKIILDDIQDNWIVTARRYFLDPVKWEVMDIPYIDYEKLVIQKDEKGNDYKFAGQRWNSRTEEKKDILVDETMAMQGSFWIQSHDWWNKIIGELDTENYGPLIQDSHEMIFKTWKAGGKMMLSKKTWFAHKERSFPRSHNNGTSENPADCERGYKYALATWGEYFEEIKQRWGI